MNRTLTLSLAALSIVALGAADANAFQRHVTTSGPRGTGSVSASGGCSGGTCSRSITRQGAGGYSMSHTGSVTNNGNGSYSYSGSTTGPSGQTRTRNGSVQVGQ